MFVYVYSGMFLGIYAALGFSQAVFVLLAAFALALVKYIEVELYVHTKPSEALCICA